MLQALRRCGGCVVVIALQSCGGDGATDRDDAGPSAEQPSASGASSAGAGGALAGTGGAGGGDGIVWRALPLDASASSAGGASSVASSGSSSSAASSSSSGGCAPPDLDPSYPPTLSATGLYANGAGGALAASVVPYSVLFPLWSDGAEKRRYIALPDCSTIDSSDMDHWQLPVGARVWKEFIVDGKKLETRFIKRFGPNSADFVMVSYEWNDAGNEAFPRPDGVVDASGTTHDIPAQWECSVCHERLPSRLLGFGAVELSHTDPGWNVGSLSAAGRLSVPAQNYVVPGDATTRAALGYLHANCGICHNATSEGIPFARTYDLRLSVDEKTVAQTGAMTTAVNVPVEEFAHVGITHRIKGGDPTSSCIAYRMSQRGSSDQMPPFGTKLIDPKGIAAVNAWIVGLPPP